MFLVLRIILFWTTNYKTSISFSIWAISRLNHQCCQVNHSHALREARRTLSPLLSYIWLLNRNVCHIVYTQNTHAQELVYLVCVCVCVGVYVSLYFYGHHRAYVFNGNVGLLNTFQNLFEIVVAEECHTLEWNLQMENMF